MKIPGSAHSVGSDGPQNMYMYKFVLPQLHVKHILITLNKLLNC